MKYIKHNSHTTFLPTTKKHEKGENDWEMNVFSLLFENNNAKIYMYTFSSK